MATASPRFKESDTSESTVSGPRGVGYCLPRFAISSMGTVRGDGLVGNECPRGHLRGGEIRADALRAAAAQLGGQRGIFPQAVDAIPQARRTAGLHQDAA